MNKLTYLLNLSFLMSILLVTIDEVTALDIKFQPFKSVVYYYFLFGGPVILFWNFFLLKN